VFYKDNIVCTATNRYTNDWRYFKIELGMPSKPYAGIPALYIQSAGGEEFRTDEITVSNVPTRDGVIKKRFHVPTVPTTSSPPFEPWPPNTEVYRAGSLNYAVTSNRVIQIMLVHSGKFRLVGETSWHHLPCTEEDIQQVFGSPDHIYEWFRE
jgi:hypothetical protein